MRHARLHCSRSDTICHVIFCLCMQLACAFADTDDEEAMRQARLLAKPWFVKNIQFGSTSIPVSPVTVIVLCLTAFYLAYYWGEQKVYAEASHILLTDPSEDTKTKMEGWKQKIGTDYGLFSKYAANHSACPSKSNGGKLGRFGLHDMAPPFDKACFNPKSPVLTTLGPIQTQFGWHLIWIQDRKLPK